MIKVTIVNQPINNRGDQAAHKALIKLMQKDGNIDITVLSTDPPEGIRQLANGISGVQYITLPPFTFPIIAKKARKFYKRIMHFPNIFLRMMEIFPEMKRYNRIIKKSDYILCAPGGICMGGYKNWQHIWTLSNAIALKKRTGIYGRSIGPFSQKTFSDKIFKRRSIDILKKVDYISLRDKVSQDIAENLGIAYVPTIDTAFAYVPESFIPNELLFLRNRQYCIFVPNKLNQWHQDFKTVQPENLDILYKTIITEILSRGFNVVMLPQLYGSNRTDKLYFDKLAEGFDNEKVFVISDNYDSDIQQSIIRESSFLIGARYHSIVFAVNNNVPFICLSYEHKMHGTLKLLGLEKYSLTLINSLKTDDGLKNIIGLIEDILSNRALIVSKIKEARIIAEKTAINAFAGFLSAIYNTH
jgi:colanic acid/amylovoran biosynthesis protein